MANFYTFNDPFTQLHREINRLFQRHPAQGLNAAAFPALNVYDDGETYLVKATLPGVSKEHLELTVKDRQLLLKGQRQTEPQSQEAQSRVAYHRRERVGGKFSRVLDLPQEIDTEKVSATFTDGILEIVLPRAAHAQARRITIG